MTKPTRGLPSLIERLDSWLPQTQCRQCGYPRCRAYADALSAGTAGINQCPPGGDITIQALSALLHSPPKPLDPRFGTHQPRVRAVIDESLCIGCRKCIDACPVDAIVGARKLMHTVLAHECTGCELCLPPCPVDCITMVPVVSECTPGPWPEYAQAESDLWRRRTGNRLQRLRHKRARRKISSDGFPPTPGREQMRADIRASIARARARKSRRSKPGPSSA